MTSWGGGEGRGDGRGINGRKHATDHERKGGGEKIFIPLRDFKSFTAAPAVWSASGGGGPGGWGTVTPAMQLDASPPPFPKSWIHS